MLLWSSGRNQNQQVAVCFLSPELSSWVQRLSLCLSMQEVLHWMQHQGAGPDPYVNPADEVKQKAERGSPSPEGGCSEECCWLYRRSEPDHNPLRYRPWLGKRIRLVHLHPPDTQSARRPGQIDTFFLITVEGLCCASLRRGGRQRRGERLRGTEVKGRMSSLPSSPPPDLIRTSVIDT